MMWWFTCGRSLRFGSRLVHEVTFEGAVESETTVGPICLAPLNTVVCFIVAWVVGVAFDVDEDHSTLTALVFLFERLKT